MTVPTSQNPTLPCQYATVAVLAALSTADCRVDAGPVPGASYALCGDDEGCAAPGTVHVTYEDSTLPVDGFREGDWCPVHARSVVLHARDRACYVDVEVRAAATAGTEAAA